MAICAIQNITKIALAQQTSYTQMRLNTPKLSSNPVHTDGPYSSGAGFATNNRCQ